MWRVVLLLLFLPSGTTIGRKCGNVFQVVVSFFDIHLIDTGLNLELYKFLDRCFYRDSGTKYSHRGNKICEISSF